jgi:hypothetical protein
MLLSYLDNLCVDASEATQMDVHTTTRSGPKGPSTNEQNKITRANMKKTTPEVGLAPGMGAKGSVAFRLASAPQRLHFDA